PACTFFAMSLPSSLACCPRCAPYLGHAKAPGPDRARGLVPNAGCEPATLRRRQRGAPSWSRRLQRIADRAFAMVRVTLPCAPAAADRQLVNVGAPRHRELGFAHPA